jgi:hypothetical protein
VALFGPHPLSSQLQVKLPVRLARELRLVAGDQFYWRVSDDDPSVLLLIPAEVVERRYSAGEAMEAQSRPIAKRIQALPDPILTEPGETD